MVLAVQSWALNPSRVYKQRPEKYLAIDVKTSDGTTLKAWHFKRNTNRLVLIAHDGEGNMADHINRANMFLNNGFDVIMFDYRGFGESSDFEIDNNMYIYPHFTDDMEAMIDYCRSNIQKEFSMYGFGIGAGLSLGIGYSRPEVKSIIADTPFLSMEDLETRFESWDEPMEVPFAGYDKKFEPSTTVTLQPGRTDLKIQLIVGGNDPLFEKTDMEMLTKSAPKRFAPIYFVENGTSSTNYSQNIESYTKTVINFLQASTTSTTIVANTQGDVPTVKLTDLDGNIFSTASIENNDMPFAIIVFSVLSKESILELTTIQDQSESFMKDGGPKLIAISIDDARNKGKVKPFVQGKELNAFDVYLDPSKELAAAMGGADTLPTTFIFDANKKLIHTHPGFAPGDEEALIQLLSK